MPGGAGTGVTTRYVLTSPIKEDLEDVIYDISPMDTICLTKFGRTRVNSTLHEWQIDQLRPASNNTQLEGQDFSASAAVNTQRVKNYTNVSSKEIVISGTMQAVDKAGMADALGFHVAKYGRELKRDMEFMILSRNSASAGAAASPRVSAGLLTFCETSLHIKGAAASVGTTTAWLSGGIPNSNPLHSSASTTAFTQALLETALGVAWANGGETDMVVMTAASKNVANTFTGIATRFRSVTGNNQAVIQGAADVFISNYGPHSLVISRYIETGAVACIDSAQWAVGYLRPMTTEPIAKVGDAERRMILCEWTLIGKEPRSTTKITDLAT